MTHSNSRSKPATLTFLVAAALVPAPFAVAQMVKIEAPGGGLAMSILVRDAGLSYAVTYNGRSVVEKSKLEIFSDARMAVVGHTIRENDTTWNPTYGQFSTIRDHYRELRLELTADNKPMTLLCRVFDNAVGFRFVSSGGAAGAKMSFVSEHRLVDEAAHFFGERGHSYRWPSKAGHAERDGTRRKSAKQPKPPLVSVREDGLHVGLLEADLYSATGFSLMQLRPSNERGILIARSSAVSLGEGHATPWRVLLIGESAGDLLVNNTALNLSAPCQLEDTSWIKPGKGLWDWRIHGYDNGQFVYDVDTRSYLHLIDFCANQGIDYLTIDDGWFTAADDGQMQVSPDVDIDKVIGYAKQKGVRVMLYYDRKTGDFGDETLFAHYSGLGASAIKYGFMGNNADFTRKAIQNAAENRLLVNFHDGPVPMAGVERTMPNLITREFCHAQQDVRSAFTPETFLRMAMVSALAGPLDMSNGNFGIRAINAGERKKGPRKKNSYTTTVVSEIARCLVIYSGLVTLPDAPEEYLKKSDLFDFLKQMPATWDKTLVLESRIGRYLAVARRSGDVWFVGSVNDESTRTLRLHLDFLEPNTPYKAKLYTDGPTTHGRNDPESYVVTSQTVKKGEVISAAMAVGGGHAMILHPLNQQQPATQGDPR